MESCSGKSIRLQRILDPDRQGEWIEMRDYDTQEVIFYNEKTHQVYYPCRNYGAGEIRDLNGRLLKNFNKDDKDIKEDEQWSEVPIVESQFEGVRCDIITKYTKPMKIAQQKGNLMILESNQENLMIVKQMKIDKEPIRFHFKDKELFDLDGNPLFIEWRNVTELNRDGKTILQGKFFFRGDSNSQPTRLLRKMLKLAGLPEESWSTSYKKGNALRPYSMLTTRLGGKLYTLGELFPVDTRKRCIPKKPKRKIDQSDDMEIL